MTVGVVSSVIGGLAGSDGGTNSATVPVTRTSAPTTAPAGGAVDVKTKMPSEVAALASTSASGVCRKNPLLKRRAVTMPSVVTAWPANGETPEAPWISVNHDERAPWEAPSGEWRRTSEPRFCGSLGATC